VKRVVTGHDEIFGPWLFSRLDSEWVPGRGSVIGLWDDKVGPIAACCYESYNTASVIAYLAGEGSKWLTREYLWYCFFYPFEQLRVRKILAIIESTNEASIRLNTHFGFRLEATLKEAAPKGDLLIYSMTRDQCRWLSLREKYRGQAQSSSTA
jgi:hypothetical protein